MQEVLLVVKKKLYAHLKHYVALQETQLIEKFVQL